LAEVNRQIVTACHQDEQRTINGRELTVGAALLIERGHLLPLAGEGECSNDEPESSASLRPEGRCWE
jgi:hypothetical protein